jgi:hypothetical protein
MTEMSPLRRRMIEDMTVRNLSPATQRSYVHAVALVQIFRRPRQVGTSATTRRYSAQSHNRRASDLNRKFPRFVLLENFAPEPFYCGHNLRKA